MGFEICAIQNNIVTLRTGLCTLYRFQSPYTGLYLYFLTHPSPLHVSWIIDLYIDQGQGRGLGSSDRALTGASINIQNNLLKFTDILFTFPLRYGKLGRPVNRSNYVGPRLMFYIRTRARGKVIQGQR